jgi:hypothetical protein
MNKRDSKAAEKMATSGKSLRASGNQGAIIKQNLINPKPISTIKVRSKKS